eukprot:scaffold13.g289.t1
MALGGQHPGVARMAGGWAALVRAADGGLAAREGTLGELRQEDLCFDKENHLRSPLLRWMKGASLEQVLQLFEADLAGTAPPPAGAPAGAARAPLSAASEPPPLAAAGVQVPAVSAPPPLAAAGVQAPAVSEQPVMAAVSTQAAVAGALSAADGSSPAASSVPVAGSAPTAATAAPAASTARYEPGAFRRAAAPTAVVAAEAEALDLQRRFAIHVPDLCPRPSAGAGFATYAFALVPGWDAVRAGPGAAEPPAAELYRRVMLGAPLEHGPPEQMPQAPQQQQHEQRQQEQRQPQLGAEGTNLQWWLAREDGIPSAGAAVRGLSPPPGVAAPPAVGRLPAPAASDAMDEEMEAQEWEGVAAAAAAGDMAGAAPLLQEAAAVAQAAEKEEGGRAGAATFEGRAAAGLPQVQELWHVPMDISAGLNASNSGLAPPPAAGAARALVTASASAPALADLQRKRQQPLGPVQSGRRPRRRASRPRRSGGACRPSHPAAADSTAGLQRQQRRHPRFQSRQEARSPLVPALGHMCRQRERQRRIDYLLEQFPSAEEAARAHDLYEGTKDSSVPLNFPQLRQRYVEQAVAAPAAAPATVAAPPGRAGEVTSTPAVEVAPSGAGFSAYMEGANGELLELGPYVDKESAQALLDLAVIWRAAQQGALDSLEQSDLPGGLSLPVYLQATQLLDHLAACSWEQLIELFQPDLCSARECSAQAGARARGAPLATMVRGALAGALASMSPRAEQAVEQTAWEQAVAPERGMARAGSDAPGAWDMEHAQQLAQRAAQVQQTQSKKQPMEVESESPVHQGEQQAGQFLQPPAPGGHTPTDGQGPSPASSSQHCSASERAAAALAPSPLRQSELHTWSEQLPSRDPRLMRRDPRLKHRRELQPAAPAAQRAATGGAAGQQDAIRMPHATEPAEQLPPRAPRGGSARAPVARRPGCIEPGAGRHGRVDFASYGKAMLPGWEAMVGGSVGGLALGTPRPDSAGLYEQLLRDGSAAGDLRLPKPGSRMSLAAARAAAEERERQAWAGGGRGGRLLRGRSPSAQAAPMIAAGARAATPQPGQLEAEAEEEASLVLQAISGMSLLKRDSLDPSTAACLPGAGDGDHSPASALLAPHVPSGVSGSDARRPQRKRRQPAWMTEGDLVEQEESRQRQRKSSRPPRPPSAGSPPAQQRLQLPPEHWVAGAPSTPPTAAPHQHTGQRQLAPAPAGGGGPATLAASQPDGGADLPFRGVRLMGSSWQARSKKKGLGEVRLGSYGTAEEAARAADLFHLVRMGTKAQRLNFPNLREASAWAAQEEKRSRGGRCDLAAAPSPPQRQALPHCCWHQASTVPPSPSTVQHYKAIAAELPKGTVPGLEWMARGVERLNAAAAQLGAAALAREWRRSGVPGTCAAPREMALDALLGAAEEVEGQEEEQREEVDVQKEAEQYEEEVEQEGTEQEEGVDGSDFEWEPDPE